MNKKTILLILFLLSLTKSYSQVPLLSKSARVSIITCGTGNESYSLFGHTAIRITDLEQQIDVVYNYGAFDFATPNFVAKFAKGDLRYFVIAHSYDDFIIQYHYEKRSVYEQQLDIPAVYKQKLFAHLNAILHSDARFYTYKFIDKNCTTMVVDLLNSTLEKNLIVKKDNTDITYRTVLYPYFENTFYEKLGISILFGTKVDQLAKKIFLPFELLESLKQTSFQNHPIAPKTQILLDFKKEIPSSWWNNQYGYYLLLILILFVNKKSVHFFYLFLMAAFGLFFIFMGYYSLHPELEYNYNILLFNPMLFPLLYFYVTKNQKKMLLFCILNLLMLGVYLIIMLNKISLLIVLPLILTNSIILTRMALAAKKQISSAI